MVPVNAYRQTFYQSVAQDHGLQKALDQELIRLAQPAINDAQRVIIDLPIRNVNRTVGALLGHEVTKRWKGEGLPEDTINIHFKGSAGQSFGAFVPRGITMRLEGDANDYLAKGLSGGRLIVHPDERAPFVAETQIIAGNVICYGATSGEVFIRGLVGERFCVRNSGALAVVEGVGDHGCEYMTGGRVIVLGDTGRNFGAGMSGGIAYVYDQRDDFDRRVNYEMVAVEKLDEGDREFLRATVERHYEYTESAVAKRMLAAWSVEVSRFRKVMPVDFKRVLNAMKEAQAEGLDEAATLQRVMENG
jgi:glutamate synthase (NADPH/NADH) large chain